VLTPQSIAFAAAKSAQEQGAEIVLTNFGRTVSLTQKTAKRLPTTPDVLEMDANSDEQIAAVCAELQRRWGRLDGFLHAIAFAPQDALGATFLNTPWDSVAIAVQTSAFSLKALAVGLLPSMGDGGAIVSLDFDATVAWPIYDWMGVAKAGLEAVTRYLARDLGPKGHPRQRGERRSDQDDGGQGHPGVRSDQRFVEPSRAARLGRGDPTPVGNTVAFLLSDLSSGITGELVHVDGGFHAMGTDLV
jgi:enoyl-[acyl-carrier protein] reductase I